MFLDLAALHHTFAFAIEKELIQKNPIRLTGKGYDPNRSAKPFTEDELKAMRNHIGDDLRLFLLLRWTGFRCSDAVLLQWHEVDMDRKEIEHVCKKNGKKVILPIHAELLGAIEMERQHHSPKPSETVLSRRDCTSGLLSFAVADAGKPFTRTELYRRIVALGVRSGVHAYPHRFRPTLAVDLLLRDLDIFTVARLLGDTVETVVKHYVPFVRELRERARVFLNNGSGIERPVTPTAQ